MLGMVLLHMPTGEDKTVADYSTPPLVPPHGVLM